MSADPEIRKATFRLWIVNAEPDRAIPVVRLYWATEIRKTGAIVLVRGFNKFIRKTKNVVFYTSEEDMKTHVKTHLEFSVNRIQQQLAAVSAVAADLTKLTILAEPETSIANLALKLK